MPIVDRLEPGGQQDAATCRQSPGDRSRSASVSISHDRALEKVAEGGLGTVR
jgi:hypothetical protein